MIIDCNPTGTELKQRITREAERRTLISAIRDSAPSYDLFDAFTTLKLGSYVGGFIDTWKWNSDSAFEDITIEELRLMWEDLDQCWDKYKLKQQTIQNDK